MADGGSGHGARAPVSYRADLHTAVKERPGVGAYGRAAAPAEAAPATGSSACTIHIYDIARIITENILGEVSIRFNTLKLISHTMIQMSSPAI